MARSALSDKLPCLATLKKQVRRAQNRPGFNHAAIQEFFRRVHTYPQSPTICLAFDEIFFTAGLQIARMGEGYITIGCVSTGNWRLENTTNTDTDSARGTTDDSRSDRYVFLIEEGGSSPLTRLPDSFVQMRQERDLK